MPKKIPVEEPTQNWTMYPNIILDNIDKFTDPEFKVISFMIRETIGYHKKTKLFSVSFVMENIKMSKGAVRRAINGLIEKGTLKKSGEGLRNTRKFMINWAAPKMTGSQKDPVMTGSRKDPVKSMTGSQEDPDLGHEKTQTNILKKLQLKETTTKKKSCRSLSLKEKDLIKIPQEIITKLPSEYQKEKSVLNVLYESLIIVKYDKNHILESVEYTNDYLKRGKITGSYEGMLYKTIENGWKLPKIVIKEQEKSSEARQQEVDQRLDLEKKAIEQEIGVENKIKEAIYNLPHDEFEELKNQTIASMNLVQRRLFNHPKSKKSTLEKSMITFYKKRLKAAENIKIKNI